MLNHVPIDALPQSVQDLIAVVGLPAAEAIVRERGGIRLCVPTRAKPDHWLTRLIGIEAMTALVSVYQGEEIDIPRCEAALRAAREQEIAGSSESNAELARRYGYTERGIRKLRKRVKGNISDKQAGLFD